MEQAKYLINKAFQDTVSLWQAYIKSALFCGCIILLVYFIYCVIRWKRPYKALPYYFIGMYSYYLYAVTFMTREPGSRDAINLVLFSTLKGYSPWLAVENLVMLLPFGILLPYIWKPARKWYIGPFIGFIASFIIESMQHITQRGHFEVDDILFNGIGFVIGFVIYKIIAAVRKR